VNKNSFKILAPSKPSPPSVANTKTTNSKKKKNTKRNLFSFVLLQLPQINTSLISMSSQHEKKITLPTNKKSYN